MPLNPQTPLPNFLLLLNAAFSHTLISLIFSCLFSLYFLSIHFYVKKQTHERHGLKCRFSPDSTLLATTSGDQTCHIWYTNDMSELCTLRMAGGQRWVWDCAWTRDSRFLATCSSDNAARLWHVESQDTAKIPIREFVGHQRAVTALALADTAIY